LFLERQMNAARGRRQLKQKGQLFSRPFALEVILEVMS
jgi:hypothetical protein